jgi:hypothetical protein
MKRTYQYIKRLYSQGRFKLAGDVIDLFSRKPKSKDKESRQEHNQRVLDEMKQEDRMQSIRDQHKTDRLLMSPESLALTYPEAGAPGRRYEVHVLYPSFDEDGAPFFEEGEGVEESLSVTEEELKGLQEEEEHGYIRILKVDAKLPKK